MKIRATKKQFKRGCIYYNTETNRPERVITITEDSVGTKSGKDASIEIHPRSNFRSPSKREIQDFVGGSGRFAKTALIITDAEETAIALGDKVVMIANTDCRLERIHTAVRGGNNRSLAQLISQRSTKARIVRKIKIQLPN